VIAADPLVPWTQLQALYAQQLVELGRREVDLPRIAALSRQSEALLKRLTSSGTPRSHAHDPLLSKRIAAAALQAQVLLKRTTLGLATVRTRMLLRAQRAERASLALHAYSARAQRPVSRFIDLRR
jgi:hypothetical protein